MKGGNAKDIIAPKKDTNSSKNTKIMKCSWSKFPNIRWLRNNSINQNFRKRNPSLPNNNFTKKSACKWSSQNLNDEHKEFATENHTKTRSHYICFMSKRGYVCTAAFCKQEIKLCNLPKLKILYATCNLYFRIAVLVRK